MFFFRETAGSLIQQVLLLEGEVVHQILKDGGGFKGYGEIFRFEERQERFQVPGIVERRFPDDA